MLEGKAGRSCCRLARCWRWAFYLDWRELDKLLKLPGLNWGSLVSAFIKYLHYLSRMQELVIKRSTVADLISLAGKPGIFSLGMHHVDTGSTLIGRSAAIRQVTWSTSYARSLIGYWTTWIRYIHSYRRKIKTYRSTLENIKYRY